MSDYRIVHNTNSTGLALENGILTEQFINAIPNAVPIKAWRHGDMIIFEQPLTEEIRQHPMASYIHYIDRERP